MSVVLQTESGRVGKRRVTTSIKKETRNSPTLDTGLISCRVRQNELGQIG